jgi:HAD superfamily hydrolase (TIGR01509 family)
MVFPRPIRAVVFDMDGLLIDTEEVFHTAFLAAAADIGHGVPDVVYHQMIGVPLARSHATLRAHFGDGVDIEALLADASRRFHTDIELETLLKAGVEALIDHLDRLGLPKAIATSSPHEEVRRHLGPLGLLGRFDAIVARGDYTRSKPDPDPFLVAAERLGVAPENCLALEDSHNGVRAAHAAGMMTVMVPDLLAATDEMREKCVAIAESLHHVRELLAASH